MDYLIMFGIVSGVSALFVATSYMLFRLRIVSKLILALLPMNMVLVMGAFTLSRLGFKTPWALVIVVLGTGSVVFYVVYILRGISGPLNLIAEGARRFSVGDVQLQGMDFKKIARINDRRDELGAIGQAFNALIQYIQTKVQAANSIAEGELDITLELASDQDVLGMSFQTMRDSLSTLISDMEAMYQAQLQGKLQHTIDVSVYNGAYRKVANEYNSAVKYHIDAVLLMLDLLGEYAKGDLSTECPDFPGDQIIATQRFNELRSNLLKVIDEIEGLSEAAISGNLSKRVDTEPFNGRFKTIVEGMNETLAAAVRPMEEAKQVLGGVAEGNLSRLMMGDYRGDHADFKTAINTTVRSLNDLISQVNDAISQVNSGANQVADASSSLAQGATEQASSLEEISSSIAEISSQSKVNSENAQKGRELATDAMSAATEGEKQMKELVDAMRSINGKTSEISKIIKVIDEIAFQTNLLALNAAVEAARAGVHGKGFAVVAEEVRNLAQRSSKAAGETTDLIQGSVRDISQGMTMAEITAAAISEIGTGINSVDALINQIAQDSKEQSAAVEQISEALVQVDNVTQATTANAEEGAAASEELSGQARNLAQMIRSFILLDSVEQDAHRIVEKRSNSGNRLALTTGRQVRGEEHVPVVTLDPDVVINLDDEDLGDF